MTLAVVFRRAARREFEEAALWYEERRPGLGSQFVLEIGCAVYLAAESPERFPVMHRDIRCVRVPVFRSPYSSARNLDASSCCRCSMRAAIRARGNDARDRIYNR